jgi:hypothetical protein
MFKSIVPISLVCLLAYSCTNLQRKTESVATTNDTIQTKSVQDPVLHLSDSDTILLDIQNGKATVQIYKQADQGINLRFPSGDYTRMTGMITSKDSMANIRFSQIVMPDGQMDGPFGKDISYGLPVKGDYLLLLRENLMAGDPWAGDFQVTVMLSR